MELEHRIRQRAYEIWQAHGQTDGKADEHWLAAEREVVASMTVQTPALDTSAPSKAKSRRAASSRPAQRAASKSKPSVMERMN